MRLDLQKAGMLKRISAYILDFILILILTVGFACLFSAIFGYSKHEETLDARREYYVSEYGIKEIAKDFALSDTELEALTEQERAAYIAASEAFEKDEAAIHAWSMIISLSFLIITLALLFTFLVLEFAIPLFLGNGMTVGKKIFGIGVMHENYVRIKPVTLFIRAILGKYTIETMVPVYLVLMILFGSLGIVGTVVLIGILVLQIVMLTTTKTNSAIHDLLSHTVCVDYASQMIFENADAVTAFKAQCAREAAEQSDN